MAKKTVTVGIPENPRIRIAGAIILAVALLLGSYTLGHNAGFDKGHVAGFAEGNVAGDKAGFERGYWIGRYDGCIWVFDQTGKPYVVGEGNPFTTWYYLMDLGNIYLSKNNCDTTGHGTAPYAGGPTESN